MEGEGESGDRQEWKGRGRVGIDRSGRGGGEWGQTGVKGEGMGGGERVGIDRNGSVVGGGESGERQK